MRSVSPEAMVFIALGMGVVGNITGVMTYPLVKHLLPQPPVQEVSSVDTCADDCEMDLGTCQMELAGAQEEIAVRQQQVSGPRVVVCEACVPRGCTETCRSCFQAMAEITKILEEP